MIEPKFDDIPSGTRLGGGVALPEEVTPFDRALAIAFAPTERGGDPTRSEIRRSPAFPCNVPDRYQVVEPIAHGGQGLIIRVRDTNLGRELALKTIHPGPTGGGQARAHLEVEAQVLAWLEHPGIPPVHERGVLPDGRPFFAMRLVRGRTLAELVAESSADGRLESDRPGYLRLFEQICRTVAYAHRRGILHRDLKPSNVMVGAFGEVQVMDWGLARSSEAGPAVEGVTPGRGETTSPHRPDGSGPALAAEISTLPGRVVGTAAYMPVEQACGWSARHGPASDVFGLGGILCVLLTGHPPYAGCDAPEALIRAARGDLGEALARLDACGADPALVELARGCLAVDLDDRIPDARTVAEMLSDHLARADRRLRDAEIRRAEAEARAEGERRRRRLIAALAGTLALAAALGLGLRGLRQRQEGVLGRAHAGAAALLGRARRSGRDPSLWRELRGAMRALAVLVGDGPGDSPAARRAAGLLDRFRLDDVALERLERIQLDQGGLRDGFVDDSSLAAEYERLFRSYGIDVRTASPEDSARRLRRGAIPIPLCGALDEWAMLTDRPVRSRLLATTRCADPEPIRDRVRRALAAARPDPAPLVALAGTLDVRATTPATVLLLARALMRLGSHDAAVDLLWRARSSAPGDFWINQVLGRALLKSDRHRPAEAIPFLTAATALHPDSAAPGSRWRTPCGRAHRYEQSEAASDRAATAYRAAIRRDPDDDLSRAYLGVVLMSRGQLTEARDLLAEVRPGETESAIALLRAAGSRSSWATSAWPSDAAAPRWGASPGSSRPACSWAGPGSTSGISPGHDASSGGRATCPRSRTAVHAGSITCWLAARRSSARSGRPAGSSPRSPMPITSAPGATRPPRPRPTHACSARAAARTPGSRPGTGPRGP